MSVLRVVVYLSRMMDEPGSFSGSMISPIPQAVRIHQTDVACNVHAVTARSSATGGSTIASCAERDSNLLDGDEWKSGEFGDLLRNQHIVPLVVFIPVPTAVPPRASSRHAEAYF